MTTDTSIKTKKIQVNESRHGDADTYIMITIAKTIIIGENADAKSIFMIVRMSLNEIKDIFNSLEEPNNVLNFQNILKAKKNTKNIIREQSSQSLMKIIWIFDRVFKNNGNFRGKRHSLNQKSIFTNKTSHCDISKADSHNTDDYQKIEDLKDKKDISNIEQIENREEPEFSFEELKEIYDKEIKIWTFDTGEVVGNNILSNQDVELNDQIRLLIAEKIGKNIKLLHKIKVPKCLHCQVFFSNPREELIQELLQNKKKRNQKYFRNNLLRHHMTDPIIFHRKKDSFSLSWMITQETIRFSYWKINQRFLRRLKTSEQIKDENICNKKKWYLRKLTYTGTIKKTMLSYIRAGLISNFGNYANKNHQTLNLLKYSEKLKHNTVKVYIQLVREIVFDESTLDNYLIHISNENTTSSTNSVNNQQKDTNQTEDTTCNTNFANSQQNSDNQIKNIKLNSSYKNNSFFLFKITIITLPTTPHGKTNFELISNHFTENIIDKSNINDKTNSIYKSYYSTPNFEAINDYYIETSNSDFNLNTDININYNNTYDNTISN
ncbi:hypothetical protein H8356DRAFT_1360716 [Neocallimastix lanati (nom. inval.)]|nr:hypothetical protein H8356DRAFT_1360716 [Neocallimastix sp. JGI-2020a]